MRIWVENTTEKALRRLANNLRKVSNKAARTHSLFNAKKNSRQYAERTRQQGGPGFIPPGESNSFKVGELIAALKQLPQDQTVWVGYHNQDYSGVSCTGLGFVGMVEQAFYGAQDPSLIVRLQPLSPQAMDRNRSHMLKSQVREAERKLKE